MKQLLSEVEQGKWEGVLVMEIERLGKRRLIGIRDRNPDFSVQRHADYNRTKIYELENDFDLEYFEFSLFMSRREYKTINRRMQAGRLASIKEGKYVGNIARTDMTVFVFPTGKVLHSARITNLLLSV